MLRVMSTAALPESVLFRPVEWRTSSEVMPGEPEGGFVLPVGTVTLLLSDFEGSVRAWQADPDAMAAVVRELETAVDDVVGRHGGVRPVEQGEGDSFVAAFSRATEAVAAALDLQLATAERTWPGGIAVRLRMALHTGEAQLRGGGNYMGAAINRCARLRALAHGGQVLVSGATHDLVADHHQLPDVDFADMGTHRLRDLARPEHVFQLRHPGLIAEFPPLRGLDVVPNNLPTQLTTFIGRTAEVAEVAGLLGEHRLVTLTGSGGCGKTRLALQAAADLSASFPDGVWFADLAPIGENEGVATAVAAALGAVTAPGQSPLDAVVARAKSSTLALVLDNCEHLIDSCCQLVGTVLRSCPDVRVLATSREVLGVEGEVPWRVPSLPLPPEAGPAGADALAASDAVRLFVDRAVKARPNFSVTNETAADVAAICRRLDGIPLAIELAAARVRVLSPAQIAAGLDDRFRLLGGGARTALARQQTLAASVAWSHDLLDEEERAVLRRLSVFSGSFDLDAAEAAAAGETVESWQVLDVLSALVDKSLVLAEDRGTTTRYRLLETLRVFAADRLADATEVDSTYQRTAEYYLLRAHSLGDARAGRLVADLDTLRGIVSWAINADPELGLRLAPVLGRTSIRGNDAGGARRWLDDALARDPGTDRSARAWALAELAYACYVDSDLGAAVEVATEAVDIAREVGDERSLARALSTRGRAQGWSYTLEPAAADLDEAIELARRTDDAWCLVDALENRGHITVLHGNPAHAVPSFREAVATAHAAGNAMQEAESTLWLNWCDVFLGRIPEAVASFERLVTAFEARQADILFGLSAAYLALSRAYAGDVDGARLAIERALGLSRATARTNPWLLGTALTMASWVELLAGDLDASVNMGEQAADACRAVAAPNMVTSALLCLSVARLEAGDVDGARRTNEEARELAERWVLPWSTTYGHLIAARIARHGGDREQAEDLVHQALVAAREMADQLRTTECLEFLAMLAADANSHGEAARLVGCAGALRERAGYAPSVPDRAHLDELSSSLEAALGGDELARLIEEGRSLDTDAAVAYARRGRGERKRPSSGWESLTPAELDVVRLVVEGLTNPQIAERLFITRATVKAHLAHIFPKLGVTTRAELAVLATRQGLEQV
jgi:predicted ATPase/class 3 adenylate cyclase/DNA-binding CsgD family transcriptional regulator